LPIRLTTGFQLTTPREAVGNRHEPVIGALPYCQPPKLVVVAEELLY
jgi:hypothetical protein